MKLQILYNSSICFSDVGWCRTKRRLNERYSRLKQRTLRPGPPFLQPGDPRPQRAFFSVGTPNAGSQAAKIVLSMRTQIFPCTVTSQSEFCQDLTKFDKKYSAPAAKLKGAHRFLQGPVICITPTTLKLHFKSLTHWLKWYSIKCLLKWN